MYHSCMVVCSLLAANDTCCSCTQSQGICSPFRPWGKQSLVSQWIDKRKVKEGINEGAYMMERRTHYPHTACRQPVRNLRRCDQNNWRRLGFGWRSKALDKTCRDQGYLRPSFDSTFPDRASGLGRPTD